MPYQVVDYGGEEDCASHCHDNAGCHEAYIFKERIYSPLDVSSNLESLYTMCLKWLFFFVYMYMN